MSGCTLFATLSYFSFLFSWRKAEITLFFKVSRILLDVLIYPCLCPQFSSFVKFQKPSILHYFILLSHRPQWWNASRPSPAHMAQPVKLGSVDASTRYYLRTSFVALAGLWWRLLMLFLEDPQTLKLFWLHIFPDVSFSNCCLNVWHSWIDNNQSYFTYCFRRSSATQMQCQPRI